MPGSVPGAEALEAMLAALPDVIVLIREDRTIQFMNRIETAHRPEDLIGRHAMSAVAERDREQTLAALDSVFETLKPAKQLTEVVGNDGVSSWFEGRMVPIVRDGRADFVVVVTRNVTERVAAEAELELLMKLLPVCAWCKKVRGEDGEWRSLEAYLEESSHSRVTHGMCPDCERSLAEDEGGGSD